MPATKPASAAKKTITTRDVIEWVRERIRLGHFVPGQRLVEADIIKETGASRSKVREALQRLETEGLVIIEEFRGASVKKFTWDEVRQIYRTRMALEGLAAREFAEVGSAKHKEKLRDLQNQLDNWVEKGDHDNFARLNSAWHRLIIEGSGNAYIGRFLTHLSVPIYRMLFSTFYSAQRIKNANEDHHKITAAILEGRADDADLAMREHIAEGLNSISEIDAYFYR